MVKNVELSVKQVSNGITLDWRDVDGEVDPISKVALDGTEASSIGNEVWGDILDALDHSDSKKVVVKMEYIIVDD